jgi:hypothetical protein
MDLVGSRPVDFVDGPLTGLSSNVEVILAVH